MSHPRPEVVSDFKHYPASGECIMTYRWHCATDHSGVGRRCHLASGRFRRRYSLEDARGLEAAATAANEACDLHGGDRTPSVAFTISVPDRAEVWKPTWTGGSASFCKPTESHPGGSEGP